ncbi:MAG: glutamine--fructose-6-phosphate transaminase (isomerizing) [Desulfurococcales archaeon ex4484_204]|nr:MAG: glutamine--fructose-6-phosphate transaminase (isomerizing) [Desulfurococcales archaeon ex4484_204]
MACGIVAVATEPGRLGKALGRVIRDSLKYLEYRGYDSVGFALITNEGELVIRKSKGMLDLVEAKLGFSYYDGLVGIGHTRWATHGAPSDINSHPHTDCKGSVAVAHNGIIENYLSLKEELLRRGHTFTSETDTEVVPHLMEEFKKLGLTPYEAFKKAVSMLRGAYALVAIDLDERDKVFFAKGTSPLIVGFGSGFNFLASDIPAFLRYTNRVLVLMDGEVGYITSRGVVVERLRASDGGFTTSIATSEPVDFTWRVKVIDWTPEMAMKGGYPHFMLKEIHEQPEALTLTLSGLVGISEKVVPILARADKVLVVGAGTSYHASLIGSLLFNNLAELWSSAMISSEARWYLRSVGDNDVVIAVSQSGETIDTLLAVREAKRRGAIVIALSNVVDSAIPRESDLSIYMRAGPEIGVAATKTFTAQVAVLTYLAAKAGERRGVINGKYLDGVVGDLRRAPSLISRVISVYEGRIRRIAGMLASKQSAFYLGRGLGLPVSMEGALKLKEVAYIHAEAYPAGESKHGPIALIEEGFPVVFTSLGREDGELLKSNIEEMKARYAWIIAVTPKGSEEITKLVDDVFEMPPMKYEASPVVYIVPYQLLAYYTAVSKGYDPDKPRNLAKTVTVV